MREFVYVCALIFISFQVSYAVRLSLTLHTNRDYSGESITFHNTRSDGACASTLLGNITTACYVGQWSYNAYYAYTLGPAEQITCYGLHEIAWSTPVREFRRLGPEDTTTPAILIHSGYTTYNYTIIEKVAEANIYVLFSIDRSYITTYGHSSWTLFEGTNFEGKSVCYASQRMVSSTPVSNLNLETVRSVIRGCNFSSEFINQLRDEI